MAHRWMFNTFVSGDVCQIPPDRFRQGTLAGTVVDLRLGQLPNRAPKTGMNPTDWKKLESGSTTNSTNMAA